MIKNTKPEGKKNVKHTSFLEYTYFKDDLIEYKYYVVAKQSTKV